MKDKPLINRRAYETEEALEKYSTYQLFPVEKYLFQKYYTPGEHVLDLACGGGRTTVRLYEQGMKIKGSDLSDMLIRMAKLRFPHIEFKSESYCNISEPDGSADHVLISHNGLDYAYPEEERIKAISEAYRVLKQRSGTFILSSHNIKSLHFSPYYFRHLSRIWWKVKNSLTAFKEKSYILDLGMYTFFGSPEYVTHQIEAQGFKCQEVIGFRMSQNKFFNKYFSPYIHYVFRKP